MAKRDDYTPADSNENTSKDPDADLLDEIRERMKDSSASEADVMNRASYQDDVRFENGDQWDDKARRDRDEVGRPTVTVNKCAPVVKQILGDARQNKISIKVKAVDGDSDPKVARIYDGLISNIEKVSSADTVYDTSLGFAVRGGYGYFRIITEYSDEDAFDQDIKFKRIVNPLSVYDDPECQNLDRSDRGWCFVTDTQTKESFKKEYPDSKIASGIEVGLGDQEKTWLADGTVMVAEYFRVVKIPEMLYLLETGKTLRESVIKKNGAEVIEDELNPGKKLLMIGNDVIGTIVKERKTKYPKVEWYKTNGFEILEGPIEFPSKYIPVVFVPGDEVWVEGKQILRSAIKWAKDPNRIYNWARSTAIETMAAAPRQPWLVTPGMIKGYEKFWEQANRKPLPYLLYNVDNGQIPQRQMGAIPDGGATQESMMSSDDIKSTTGIFDASLGAAGNETSGKAIIARQRQGDIGSFVFIDNLVSALEYAARVLVDMIPRVYDTKRIVRLLNPDGSEGWETINEIHIDPMTGDETLLNDISVGKFDVAVTAGPSYSTKRQEAADQMLQLVSAAPEYRAILVPKIVKGLDFDGAEELSKEMVDATAGAGQPPKPTQEEQLDIMNKVLTAEGKELVNTQRKMDIEGAINDQDERTKALIIQALEATGLLPEGMSQPV